MHSEDFDLIVIGGGSAGYAAARTARERRDRVAVVDDARELGGLCILRGCMPSKTLIYSAEVLHLARRAGLFGLRIPEATADLPAIHQRKLRWIRDFQGYRQEQLQSGRFTLFRERARFLDGQTIELQRSKQRLTAKAFVVATGSSVNVPPIDGLDGDGIWTSDDILDLDFLPESLVMLGGGIVACELAQFLQRVGCRVTLVQRNRRILKDLSPAASAEVAGAMAAEGMILHTGTELQRVEKTDHGFAVHFSQDEEPMTIGAAHVCNALGRHPNVKGLGLDHAGVEVDESGQIVVNEFQQTANPRIYAAGDVTGPYEIVHLAIKQGETAARHACGDAPAPVNYDTRTGIVFTDPQIATAGITADEARERGHEVVCADFPFDDHGKALLMEARYGFVKAWADRNTGRLLGAECVGKDAGELIHAMAVALSLQADVRDLVKVHWYHPTLSEIWSYPLEELAEQIGG